MKQLTILDIARLADVSKSTVSRVLNNDPKVRSCTSKKILAVMAEHGFTPSRSAQSMRSGKSKTIGVIVSRLDSASEGRAVRGILAAIYQQDYDVVLMESDFCTVTQRHNAELLARKQVEGVIVMALPGDDCSYLHSMPYPVVILAQQQSTFTSIIYDDHGAITQVMQHLLSLGISRPAFIGVDDQDLTTGRLRSRAYRHFCRAQGWQDRCFLGSLGYTSGYELAGQALAVTSDVPPDALVCASDTIALGVYKYLSERGRTDLVVTGVGNNDMVRFLYPRHISAKLSYKQSGQRAMAILTRKIAGENVPDLSVMPVALITA